MKKLICTLFIFTLLYPTLHTHATTPPSYQSASVLIMHADTAEIIYETNGFTFRYPASITKVMTALLVLEHIQEQASRGENDIDYYLNRRVRFSAHAVDIPYYASRMGILEGETITVLEALYGIMLPSGNEVARALAEYVSGSVPAFVARMNERASQLGATNTRFINPCGLPGDGQYVLAYDVSLIMHEAIQHPVFVRIISTPYFTLSATEIHREPRLLRNTNRMIRPSEPEYNRHVIGGKTGFTNAAQHTLVSYARRDDHRIIVTVMYAPRGVTFTDTAALMDYAFELLDAREAEKQASFEQKVENFLAARERAVIYALAIQERLQRESEEAHALPPPSILPLAATLDVPPDDEYCMLTMICFLQQNNAGEDNTRVLPIVIIVLVLGMLVVGGRLIRRQ